MEYRLGQSRTSTQTSKTEISETKSSTQKILPETSGKRETSRARYDSTREAKHR